MRAGIYAKNPQHAGFQKPTPDSYPLSQINPVIHYIHFRDDARFGNRRQALIPRHFNRPRFPGADVGNDGRIRRGQRGPAIKQDREPQAFIPEARIVRENESRLTGRASGRRDACRSGERSRRFDRNEFYLRDVEIQAIGRGIGDYSNWLGWRNIIARAKASRYLHFWKSLL